MRSRPTVILIAGIATVSSPLMLAPPAMGAASVTNGTLTCNTATYTGGTSVTADPGDPFTLNFQGPDCATTTLTFDNAALSTSIVSGQNIGTDGTSLTFLVSPGIPGGPYNMTIQTSGQAARTIAVTITGDGSASSSTSGTSDGPKPWMKAYQRATRETSCNTGWNPSYAMWANSNSGGWVCVQEEYYTGSGWATR